MKRVLAVWCVALGLVVAACGSGRQPAGEPATPYPEAPSAQKAQAGLRNAKGETVGFAEFVEVRQGVMVTVSVLNLPPGKHGIHIHAAAKCDPPDFMTAGGHFNPDAKKHGLNSKDGPHNGDLPNLVVGDNGRGAFSEISPTISLAPGARHSLLNGTSIVIHEREDDEMTDPAGNSGARIACGVIQKVTG